MFASLLLWHQPRAVGLEASLTVIGVPSAYSVPSPFPSSLPPLLHGKVFTVHILPCGWAFASRLMLVPLILCVFLAASRSWPLRHLCAGPAPALRLLRAVSALGGGLGLQPGSAQPSPAPGAPEVCSARGQLPLGWEGRVLSRSGEGFPAHRAWGGSEQTSVEHTHLSLI